MKHTHRNGSSRRCLSCKHLFTTDPAIITNGSALSTLSQGQQDFEPEAMVGKTWESETMGRTG
jgi:hypothetical protein